LLSSGWFDPIETAVPERVRVFIQNLVAAELDEALGCARYQRESKAAWRSLLDDLVSRGLPAPSFVIIDGAAGLRRHAACE
jgi:transposase-like protein